MADNNTTSPLTWSEKIQETLKSFSQKFDTELERRVLQELEGRGFEFKNHEEFYDFVRKRIIAVHFKDEVNIYLNPEEDSLSSERILLVWYYKVFSVEYNYDSTRMNCKINISSGGDK